MLTVNIAQPSGIEIQIPTPALHRLLIISTGLNRGGAETQVLHLAKGLRERGWQIEVVSLLAPGTMADEFGQAGIPVHCLGMRRKVPDPRAILRLRKIIRTFCPQVVHSHMVHANFLARVSRLVIPMGCLITTAHNTSEGGRWTDAIYRLTDNLTDLTTIICKAGAERYMRVGAVAPGRLRVVANGLPIKQFSRQSTDRTAVRQRLGIGDEFVWLAVGRFEPPKDYFNLVGAIVQNRQRPSLLLIAGDGPLRPEIERLVANLRLSDRIRLLGIRKDVPALMAAADAYVMSSAWEGLPMVLLEAAASALPIVATDVGGNREIVSDGVNGFLVPGRDSALLAEAMLAMERLPLESLRSMGAAGRVHVSDNYSLPAIIDQCEGIYGDLLEKHSGSPVDSSVTAIRTTCK